MPKNLILDLFYNEIVLEASTGKIDCFFIINIFFNLTIENKIITTSSKTEQNDIIIPTLKIVNKELFDSLLIEYVTEATKIYSHKEVSFLEDLDYIYPNQDNKDIKQKYLIKYIICTLLANASYTDFENPIKFLQNRICMLNSHILNKEELINMGYFSNIGASLFIKEEPSPIRAETPYRIVSYLEYDDGYKLQLPEIYIGKTEEKYYIYGIQKTSPKTDIDETKYIKQIRKGLNSHLYGTPEHYFITYILALVLSNDKPIEVIPFLVERWNAKSIYLSKNKNNKEENEEYKKIIQSNITDSFLRIFLKLQEITPQIEMDANPFIIDDHLHISMLEQPNSKASIMNELYNNYITLSQKNPTLTKK